MGNARRETWARKRKRCQHLTPDEVEYVQKCFREGVRAFLVAKKLECSERVVQTRYAALRGEAYDARHPRLQPRPKSAAAVPSRFYRSNFEPH